MKNLLKISSYVLGLQILFTIIFNLFNICLSGYGILGCNNSYFSNTSMLYKYIQILTIPLICYFIFGLISYKLQKYSFFKNYLIINAIISLIICLIVFSVANNYIPSMCKNLTVCDLEYLSLLYLAIKFATFLWIFYLGGYLIYFLIKRVRENQSF